MSGKPVYKRVLLKLSGENFCRERQGGLSMAEIGNTAQQIKQIHQMGVQLAIVVGGGNILRGKEFSSGTDAVQPTTAHYMGMIATVINGLALQDVEPESAADRAGIQKDDVIIGFQGNPIESFNTLIETIKGSEPGDKVKITILRDTVDEGKHKLKQFELDVTLEPWIDESIAAMRERQKERATQQK